MRKCLFIFSLVLHSGYAEDLLTSQPGVSIPAGTWTDITSSLNGLSGVKIPYYVTGWDKYWHVPAIDRWCGLGSYWEPSSEPNRSWSCYSFKEHRWDHWEMGGNFHNEHMNEGGHPTGWVNIDPTTSVALGPCCMSGAQVPEYIKWGMWKYDFVGHVGLPQQPPRGLNINNQLGTAAYDVFNQKLVGFGGDSSNQGLVQYDNDTSHTSCPGGDSSHGTNCYNTWALPLTSTGSAPASSLIEHAMALNTTDKKIYLYGGYSGGRSRNELYSYEPVSKVWTLLTPTCESNGGGTLCPGDFTVTAATSSTDTTLTAPGHIFKSNGSGGTTITLSGATGCWAAINGTRAVTAVSGDTFRFAPPVDTSACSEPITGAVIANSGRVLEAFAYGANADVFLMHGGFSTYGIPGLNNTGQFLDTWTYSPVDNKWTQLNPGTIPIYCASLCAPNERLTWIPEDDVWIMFINPGGTANAHLWAFRLPDAPGTKAGYLSKAYSFTSVPDVGPLNRQTTSAAVQGYAFGSAITADSTAVYQAWTETKPVQTGAAGTTLHPYARRVINGTGTSLPSPNDYNSFEPDTTSNSYDMTLAMVNGTVWACYNLGNPDLESMGVCKGWSGSAWSVGTPSGGIYPHSTVAALPPAASSNGMVYVVTDGATASDCTAGGGTREVQFCRSNGTSWVKVVLKDGQIQMAGVAGIPTVVYRQQDRTTGNLPSPTYAYVRQWTGQTWTQLGGRLNSGATTVADSVSIASDGTAPWVALTLYTPTNTLSPFNGVNISAPQLQLFKWDGANWTQQCGNGNVAAGSRAFHASLSFLGGVPYVAFVERTNQGKRQLLYVRKCESGTWTTIGGGAINRDTTVGWAFRPELVSGGSALYMTWAEQGNPQPWVNQGGLVTAYSQKPKVYVSKWNGVTWAFLGGALNADPVNGAATHPSIALFNDAPVVSWGEIVAGNLRQIYSKEWNGSDWVAVIADAVLPPPTTSRITGTLRGGIR
jgi:hypothetical protein